MSELAMKLLGEGVPWLVALIGEAVKGDPAPTEEEAKTKLNALIDARTRDEHWLDDALAAADKKFEAEGTQP